MHGPYLHRFALLSLGVLLLLAGCETRSSSRKRFEALQQRERTKVDEFEAAFNFLTGMHQFNPSQAATQASYHLNNWLGSISSKIEWKRDPLLDRIPSEFAPLVSDETLRRESFTFDDTYYIESANILADLADRVSKQEDPRLQAWFEENPDQLSDSNLEKLVLAQRLFDWVIRDIQLDPTAPKPKRTAAGAGGPSEQQLRPSQQFKFGPGYVYLPRQTLIYGHGDKWNRSRVFIALTRQRGIDTVVLAADPQFGEIRPWLTGVRIGKQIYLFDCELGLPIPNSDGVGIATLETLQKTPAILENLKAGDLEYAFKAKDLERVIALLDASPEAVSYRMKQLESSLSGARRITLTVEPSKLAAELRQCPGIAGVSLWTVPFDAVLFQKELNARIQDQNPSAALFAAERFLLSGDRPIIRGRRLHLRGVFEANEDEQSAKSSYMSFRVDEATLAKMASDEGIQKQMGLKRTLSETDAEWANRLYVYESELRKGKQNASYWLGLVHFESGDLKAAIDWLQRRTIEANAEGGWRDSASYNLARTYEMQGDIDSARGVLLLDESPQALGNKIRARLLREWAASKKEAPAADAS